VRCLPEVPAPSLILARRPVVILREISSRESSSTIGYVYGYPEHVAAANPESKSVEAVLADGTIGRERDQGEESKRHPRLRVTYVTMRSHPSNLTFDDRPLSKGSIECPNGGSLSGESVTNSPNAMQSVMVTSNH
jgi:hypothetical protein